MAIAVARICRYPLKGLSAEDLERVALRAGEGLAQDRRFALALSTTRFDPDAPRWLPKTSFLMLMRDARLAALRTRFDEDTGFLTIGRGGREVARGRITDPVGRAVVEDFFAAYMRGEARGKPRLVEAAGHAFSDHRDKVLSLVNLASVRDLERIVGAAVDPLRFRANLYIEGAAPWVEFDWVGSEVSVGGARLGVTGRIDRCAATNVDPRTADRDMNIPRALQRGFGHADMGIYAAVLVAGPVAVGDGCEPPGGR